MIWNSCDALRDCCLYPFLLRHQYRLPCGLEQICNKHFYGSCLFSAAPSDLCVNLKSFFIIAHESEGYNSDNKGSKQEVDFVARPANALKLNNDDDLVCTPYADQRGFLKEWLSTITPHWIDACEGKTTMYLLCNMGRRGLTLGHTADLRRVNVGLSRSELACIIVLHNFAGVPGSWLDLWSYIRSHARAMKLEFVIGAHELKNLDLAAFARAPALSLGPKLIRGSVDATVQNDASFLTGTR